MFSSVHRYVAYSDHNSELIPILSSENCDRRRKSWPSTYWLVLKVLCLFHGRKIVSSRRCYVCRLRRLRRKREDAGDTGPLPNYLFPAAIASPAGWWDDDEDDQARDENVNEISDDERVDNCEVCDSMWWDADGERHEYKEEDIGVRTWNHRGSIHLSVLLQLICIGFLLYDGAIYIKLYWGNAKQLLRLLSYGSYLANITAVPAICLVANLRNIVPRSRVGNFAWTTALHPRYIMKRLQYLRPDASGIVKKPLLFLCLVWSFGASFYRAWIYIFLVNHDDGLYVHDDITIFTDGIITVIWGCFCYLMSVLRLSIRNQLHQDVNFLLKHVGKVDICRRRLGTSLDEYGSLSNTCAMWMFFTVSATTLGLSCHTSWNYLLYSNQVPMSNLEMHINLMIWIELLMFLVLPLLVVGGLDLHHMLEDFLTHICEVRCDENNEFWDKMVKFITQEFNPVTNVVQLTLLFSVISLYMALQVGDQNANYWGEHNITATTIGPPESIGS